MKKIFQMKIVRAAQLEDCTELRWLEAGPALLTFRIKISKTFTIRKHE